MVQKTPKRIDQEATDLQRRVFAKGNEHGRHEYDTAPSGSAARSGKLGHLELLDTAMTPIDAELDTSGLSCPLPILKAKKALASLRGGQVLRVTATDPESVRDFETFSRQMGHALLEAREEAGRFYFLIRKRED